MSEKRWSHWEKWEEALKWIGIGLLCLVVNQGTRFFPMGAFWPLDHLVALLAFVTFVGWILASIVGFWKMFVTLLAYAAFYWPAFGLWMLLLTLSVILVINQKVFGEPTTEIGLLFLYLLPTVGTVVFLALRSLASRLRRSDKPLTQASTS